MAFLTYSFKEIADANNVGRNKMLKSLRQAGILDGFNNPLAPYHTRAYFTPTTKMNSGGYESYSWLATLKGKAVIEQHIQKVGKAAINSLTIP